ncbi:MAG: glycogen debranching protein GlgX [Treponema sp.]|nr:glycogen debranching protein GlgX [Treponema sp.]
MTSFEVLPGKPRAYGAMLTPQGINFSLFSRHATSVTLYLFDAPNAAQPAATIVLDAATHRTGDVWHVLVTGLGAGTLYLYQVDGPYNPPQGHRFNSNKYVFDPYARAFTAGSVFRAYRKQRTEGRAGIENGRLSDLSDCPKCIVVADADFDWQGDRPLEVPLEKTIIYEMHVKGFTASPTAGVAHPGTYRGVIEKIDYLKSLGVTAVELLPIFEFDEYENDHVNPRTGEMLTNYWGYSTIGFFAPKTTYSSDCSPGGAVREFKEMVRELHKAGIEVILDVVYNHTAEGNEYGTTFCFRGLENSVYYLLPPEKQYYMNYSGCGNTVNCNHPIVRNFIIDSLRYWVTEMHVDGFRFDLASALSRSQEGHVVNFPPLPNLIAEDPFLRGAKIIAEPWDAGGGYQLGAFPGGMRWCEWNGRFRDDMRRFIRGDERVATDAATRFAGSSDIFKPSGRSPLASINFITAHDGFTLADMVSYNTKHNEENGEDNRDGSDDNYSYNNGFEGDSTNTKIVHARLRKVKNFFICLFTAQGTPQLLGGDEVLRTQRGNNNAYCQDNELSWMDWTLVKKNYEVLHFVRTLIRLRLNHPLFQRVCFFTGTEIVWYNASGKNPDWNELNRFLAFQLIGTDDNDFYVAFNTDIYDRTLTVPSPTVGTRWYRVADTSITGGDDIREEGDEEPLHEQVRYVLPADSAIILMSK